MKRRKKLKSQIIDETADNFLTMYYVDYKRRLPKKLNRCSQTKKLFELFDYLEENNLILFDENTSIDHLYSVIHDHILNIDEEKSYDKKFFSIRKTVKQYIDEYVTVQNIYFNKW